MSSKRKERIELLEEVRDIVGKTIRTDREMYDYYVRRDNRKLAKIMKNLEEWKDDLERSQRIFERQEKLKKRKTNVE